MRILAARFANHFCRGRSPYLRSRNYSSLKQKDDLTLEEEAERKIGWLLKLFFAGTASYIGYQFFPYMGELRYKKQAFNGCLGDIGLASEALLKHASCDNLIHQSISLLHVKDPLFKRMGASRLSRFAIDDERRMKVVELGGAQELLHMLGTAKDDKTRREALKALAALSKSDEAANFLGTNGAFSIVESTPDSSEDSDISTYKSSILKKLDDKKLAIASQ